MVHSGGSTSAAGEGLVYRWLEASDVFHRHVLSVSRLQVLVQDGENLVVEDLEFADSVDHLLQWLKGSRKYEYTQCLVIKEKDFSTQ